MKRDRLTNIDEANAVLVINKGITTKTAGWENHQVIKNVKRDMITTKKQLDIALKEFASIKGFLNDYAKDVKLIEDKHHQLVEHVNDYIKVNGAAFARYKGTKEVMVEQSTKELTLYIASTSAYTQRGEDKKLLTPGFTSSRVFLNSIVELVSKTKRLQAWYKRNNEVKNKNGEVLSIKKTDEAIFAEVKNFASTIFNKLMNGEHRDVLKYYSKFYQVNRDTVYNNKAITFSYLEGEYEKVKVDIATAESKLGWSTAFFTIIISILVSIGLALDNVNLIWLWIGLGLILPVLSFFTLIWGMNHMRNTELERLLDEEKMLFLKRDENINFDWQSELGRANVARLIDNTSFEKEAKKYMVDSSTSVYYEKEKLLLLVKQYRSMAKRKTTLANIASAITFIFPVFLIANPNRVHNKMLKKYEYNDNKEAIK